MRRILPDPAFAGPTVDQYCGDLQVHSAWSDGSPTLQEIADACVERGYQYAAVSGLRIAGGTSMAEAAAQRGVAIEIDGDPARQDVDFTLGRQALPFGCIFALDDNAHATAQLSHAETALAHARLAAIPPDRIVNCWPLERLLAWLADPSSESLR